jgi:alpha-amylase/alpha-mannosidase (GH57 family)
MELNDPEMKKSFCLCVHGHFYQPPRENPWLEIIELQRSASPYHDWNERITRECYGPNTRARLHGNKGRITKLINNYEYMSFDFGPTLLSWLEVSHPWIYSQILAADKASQKRYNGHGNAMAQVYNHVIMPLATHRDKVTQIRWGIADFKHRFAREPEGMWLAETAVDTETLEIMADEGIKFTILSPSQASAIRSIGFKSGASESIILKDKQKLSGWTDVSGGLIDPTRPYRVFLKMATGKYIDVFFYDGPLSRAIAYEKILSSGEELLGRINSILGNHKDGPRLLSIATDGESYGHHFKFGEMALSWLFNHVENENKINLINFGAFLELFPPKLEVRIIEESSWSCAHGVERWRSDCGCSVNGNKECNQHWRAPLRDGLEWLSSELALIFEKRGARLLKNPWETRDEYIITILDEPQNDSFLQRHAIRPLKEDEKTEALCLLESQRMALYMFTSCGWFFDDISGIESIQILMYALRAIELVRRSSPNDLEKGLMDFLERAESNDPSHKNGARIFETKVKPSRISPSLAAANYAVMSLVDGIDPDSESFSTIVLPLRQNQYDIGGTKSLLAEVKVVEKRTGKETRKRLLAVLEKSQGFSCVTGSVSAPDYELINDEIARSFSESPETLITVFSMMAQDIQYFTMGDLIPDIRLGVINALANSFHGRIKHSLDTDQGLLEEFVNVLHLTQEPPPSVLMNLFRLLFAEKFFDLLDGDNDEEQIDFIKFFNLLCLFQYDSHQIKSEDKKLPSFLKEIMTEPVFKKKAQDFLLKNMNSFVESEKIIIIKNMINFLKLTISQEVDLDLWEGQNIFYDNYKKTVLSIKDNPQVSSMLMELGDLLGFSIEEK